MIGWTPEEQLVVMAEDGTYRIYDLSAASAGISTRGGDPAGLISSASLVAGEYRQYTLGSEVADVGVISGQVHDDGFVVLTGSLAFVHVKGWKGGRAAALCATGEFGLSPREGSDADRSRCFRYECAAAFVDCDFAGAVVESACRSACVCRRDDFEYRRPVLC
jgi:hypothetical protein